MNLKAERRAVADLLTAGGVRAVAHVPSRPTPPFAMVTPGAPYLSAADTFGGARTLRLAVWLVIGEASDNAALTDAMDDRISAAVDLLAADDWLIEDVQVDRWEPASGGSYLVGIVGINTTITP